jgi:hypothetical protein
MSEDKLLLLQGLAFLLLSASAILSLLQKDYSTWAINTTLAMMILSAGNIS